MADPTQRHNAASEEAHSQITAQRLREGTQDFDPATLVWFDAPADAWDASIPVGNGRLGAMTRGGVNTETIDLNEETYWTGGPYNPTNPRGADALQDVRDKLFAGNPRGAHKRFGRDM